MSENQNLSELLVLAGYQSRVAKAVAWLITQDGKTITSRELELGADLRQPDAHYAIDVLTNYGWLKNLGATELPKRGRPYFNYQFILSKEGLFTEVQKKTDASRKEIADIVSSIKAALA